MGMKRLVEDSRVFFAVRWIGRLLLWAGVGLWFVYGALVMSWAGHRPLRPQPPFTVPYEDHGTLFITLADLQVSHWLLLACGVLVALGLVGHFAERLWPEGREDVAKRKAYEHQLRVRRENARLQRENKHRAH
jgi:DNA-binding helix-hairpin-helix protein with protein kinase domain